MYLTRCSTAGLPQLAFDHCEVLGVMYDLVQSPTSVSSHMPSCDRHHSLFYGVTLSHMSHIMIAFLNAESALFTVRVVRNPLSEIGTSSTFGCSGCPQPTTHLTFHKTTLESSRILSPIISHSPALLCLQRYSTSLSRGRCGMCRQV